MGYRVEGLAQPRIHIYPLLPLALIDIFIVGRHDAMDAAPSDMFINKIMNGRDIAIAKEDFFAGAVDIRQIRKQIRQKVERP